MGVQMRLFHHRLKLQEAQEFVAQYHRHSPPLKRHMFSIGASPCNKFYSAKQMYGIVTVDRCSSAWSKRRDHAEIRRLCVADEECVTEKNLPLASFLLGKARQACFAMGYRVLITYTQPHESGASLKAAGFYIQKYNAKKFGDGSIEGLVQWVCWDGHQPDEKEREFTKNGLEELKQFQLA